MSVDEGSIAHIKGAHVVWRGDFIGVVAPQEFDAIRAAAELKATWADPPTLRRRQPLRELAGCDSNRRWIDPFNAVFDPATFEM